LGFGQLGLEVLAREGFGLVLIRVEDLGLHSSELVPHAWFVFVAHVFSSAANERERIIPA